jgi:hypothetical protein
MQAVLSCIRRWSTVYAWSPAARGAALQQQSIPQNLCNKSNSYKMQSHGPRHSSYQNQDPGLSPSIPEESAYSDSSGAIFSMYISRAHKFDEENAENWKGGAEGILFFVRPESRLLNQYNCLLTRSLLLDRSFRIYSGHLYFH